MPSDGGDPGEIAALEAVRAEHEPKLARELGKVLAFVVAGKTASAMLARADSLPYEGLLAVINPFIKDAASVAISIQAELLLTYGIGVPVSLAESFVAQWANRYDYNLVSGINRNSRSFLQKQVSTWARSNEGLPQLIERLEPMFGKTRAELIGSTEATRAFTEGTFTAWERAGFNRRPPEVMRPPAHPRCRCFVSLMPGDTWQYVWYTVNDQLVCPICEPRHLQVIGQAGNI